MDLTPSYNHSYKCREGKTGGRVSILIHEKYSIEAITEPDDMLHETAESLL